MSDRVIILEVVSLNTDGIAIINLTLRGDNNWMFYHNLPLKVKDRLIVRDLQGFSTPPDEKVERSELTDWMVDHDAL
jgi:hypothetical protein